MNFKIKVSKECIAFTLCFLPGLSFFFIGIWFSSIPTETKNFYMPIFCIGGFFVVFSTFYFLIRFEHMKNKIVTISFKGKKNKTEENNEETIPVTIHKFEDMTQQKD